MRRAVFAIPLFVALGCNAGVPDDVGFGSGAEGGSSPAGGTGEGPATGDSEPSASAGDSEGTGGSSGSDPTAASASDGDESGGTSGASGGGSEGGETGLDTEGDSTSGSETGEDSGDTPIELDACGFRSMDRDPDSIRQRRRISVVALVELLEHAGLGEAQWAASNASWPEVWDLYQNINVSNDPIGVVAVVGSSAQLQLMLGFEELVAYDYATVCVEGRSVSTSASVQFDAYNPLTGIGNSGSMAHDWSVHATGLDLGQAFEPGGGVQAVRLDTTGGSASLGVKRMRLIMHGAVY